MVENPRIMVALFSITKELERCRGHTLHIGRGNRWSVLRRQDVVQRFRRRLVGRAERVGIDRQRRGRVGMAEATSEGADVHHAGYRQGSIRVA